MSLLLKVSGLTTSFHLPHGAVRAVDGVDFSVDMGETLAIVGESGCGKSVTAYSVMRLVVPPGRIESGEVLFNGRNLLALSEKEMQGVRGNHISMIFQEPMTSLNPVMTVGSQIAEGLMLHRGLSGETARREATEILRQVGIPSPAARYNDYPHQMSGGMRQRIMIAMALACRPRLLIADEPTTALDVTIQAQILELIDLMKESSGMGLILITHDLGIVSERARNTAIMYAGRIMEYASSSEIFHNPLHPYTQGLLESLPQNSVPGRPIRTIPGNVPDLFSPLPGCGFCDRCPITERRCREEKPEMKEVGGGHMVRCWKYQ